MTSTIKTDALTTKSDDTDLTITGHGTGVPNIEAGFKVGGSAGVPTASIQDDAVTLAKMASGVDGVIITYDASGNPVHVGPGSDGQVLTSTGAGSPPAFEDAAGGPDQASQAEMEAETNVDKYIAPDLLKNGPSSCKAWVKFDLAGTVNASYNVSSVTDNSTGLWTVNWNTDFSSVNYVAVPGWRDDDDKVEFQVSGGSQAAGTYEFKMVNGGGSFTDPNAADDMHVVAFGDH